MAGGPVGDRTDRIRGVIGDRPLHNGLDSPQRAAAYLDDGEYPHDWDTETMVDLETGASFSPVVTTRWEPAAP